MLVFGPPHVIGKRLNADFLAEVVCLVMAHQRPKAFAGIPGGLGVSLYSIKCRKVHASCRLWRVKYCIIFYNVILHQMHRMIASYDCIMPDAVQSVDWDWPSCNVSDVA